MSIRPQVPTADDIVSDRQDRVRRFLSARGDPNHTLPLQLVSLMLPHHPPTEHNCASHHRHDWIDSSLPREDLMAAVEQAHVVDTELSILQFSALLERPHMIALILDGAMKPVSLEPSPLSLFPAPLYLAAMYKSPNPHRCSPAALRSSFGSLAAVEAQLTRGVDPKGRDIISGHSSELVKSLAPLPLFTPLHLACLHGHHLIAAALIQSGGLRQTSQKELMGVLVACAMSCSIRCLMLVRRGRELLVDHMIGRSVTENGRTLLHYAVLAPLNSDCIHNEIGSEDECSCESDYEERRGRFCQLLVGLGCPVDASSASCLHGDTALHLAWRTGKSAIARMLVEELNANPAIRNAIGELPFECHAVGMSSAHIAVHGGACGLVQDSGPLSNVSFLKFLLQWVYPQCMDDTQSRDLLGQAILQPSERSGGHVLHALCASPYWMHHVNRQDMLWVVHEMCLLAQSATSSKSDFDVKWINCPIVSEVAGAPRCATPLVLAIEQGSPLELVQLLLRWGACPTSRATRSDLHEESKLSPPLNAFQALASQRQPFPHIGETAILTLLAVSGDHDRHANHEDAGSVDEDTKALIPSLAVLNSLLTHPTCAQRSMLDVPLIQTHPFWQSFYEVMMPPVDEKDRRRREAERFYKFQSGDVSSLVAEIEPTPHATAKHNKCSWVTQFSSVVTPLSSPPCDAQQGAFVVAMHTSHGRPALSEQTQTNAAVPEVSRDCMLRQRHEWSFQERLKAILTRYDNTSMPARNFYYEQQLHDENSCDVVDEHDGGGLSLFQWVASFPDGSLVASYLINRFTEWQAALDQASDGDATWVAMCDHTRTRSLGLRRHYVHHQVGEEARQRTVGMPLLYD